MSPTPWIDLLTFLLEEFEDWLEPSHYRIAFQLMTFEMFSLDYSCVLGDVDVAPDDGPEDDDDDDPENDTESEEDQQRRETFERIIMETEQMIEADTGTIFQDSDRRARADGLARDIYLVLAKPPPWRDWLTRWGKTIEPELAKLKNDVMSTADRAKAEELGVLWCDPPPAPAPNNAKGSRDVSGVMVDNSLDVYSHEYKIRIWHQRLEEIE